VGWPGYRGVSSGSPFCGLWDDRIAWQDIAEPYNKCKVPALCKVLCYIAVLIEEYLVSPLVQAAGIPVIKDVMLDIGTGIFPVQCSEDTLNFAPFVFRYNGEKICCGSTVFCREPGEWFIGERGFYNPR